VETERTVHLSLIDWPRYSLLSVVHSPCGIDQINHTWVLGRGRNEEGEQVLVEAHRVGLLVAANSFRQVVNLRLGTAPELRR
jgi:hypothetical protein